LYFHNNIFDHDECSSRKTPTPSTSGGSGKGKGGKGKGGKGKGGGNSSGDTPTIATHAPTKAPAAVVDSSSDGSAPTFRPTPGTVILEHPTSPDDKSWNNERAGVSPGSTNDSSSSSNKVSYGMLALASMVAIACAFYVWRQQQYPQRTAASRLTEREKLTAIVKGLNGC
jgi:hypothetical protein